MPLKDRKDRPSFDPFGFTPRLARLMTGLLALTLFFTGADAMNPGPAEMNREQIEKQLSDATGPLREFVKTLEKSLLSGNLEVAESFVDRGSILARATRGAAFDGDDVVRDIFCESTLRAWDERGVTRDYAGTRFRFLRCHTLAGRDGLLFRSSKRDGTVNYALFTLRESGPAQFRITDIFVVGLNEFLSDTLRRTWLNVAAGFLGDEAHTVEGVNPTYIAHIGEVAQLSRDMNAGKYEEVLRAARLLPASVQSERTVLLLRMEAAEHVSIAERNAVYAAWLESYPDEMELPLKFIDFYVNQHRWDDAERVIRGLMGRLGEDAMLKMELGSVMFRRRHEEQMISASALTAGE
jgi:hypothetical protein